MVKKSDYTSGGSTQTTQASTLSTVPKVEKQSKSVSVGRIIFIVFFLASAAIMGWLAFFLLTRTETELVNEQYASIMDSALSTCKRITDNKLLGATTMARVAGYTYPDSSSWPFVIVPGWYAISETVVATSIVGGLSLAPLVYPEDLPEYEEMAYKHYNEVYPNETAGISAFGKGVWSKDKSLGTEDDHFHDTTGETDFSPYKLLCPKLQHSKGNHRLLMMNVHSFETQGLIIDTAINCTKTRALSENPKDIDCQSVSDLLPPKDPTAIKGPGAYVATPIYPANNDTQVVGMIFAKINWNEVLENVFTEEVSGIDCVIETDYQVFTYTILKGIGTFVGEGDLHDTNYDEFGGSVVLLNQTHLTADSVAYTITFYPNDDLDDMYRTDNPKIATIGAVLIMLFTSILFFLYDFFVHKEFRAKSNLLTAKRQFVRYVSHEVRTPLNSVCMGLTLLQEEIALSLGFDSIEDMMTSSDKKRLARSKIDGKDDEWFQLASEVQINAQSSVDVLNDLLNYDKIESGTLSLELQVIKVWELIEQTVSEFKLPASTRKIKLDLKLPGDNGDEEQSGSVPWEVRNQKAIGDSVRITQVLRNLISNALKFTPENSSVQVEARWNKTGPNVDNKRSFELKDRHIQTSQCSGELVLTVKDMGAGMSKEQLAKLFGQGVQFNVNELQAGQGSGLGLYIAKGIAEQHEGTLMAESLGLGCGTTFTLTVPLYHIPDEKLELVSPSERKLNASTFKQPPLRVLIVDDAATNRKLLGRLLKNRGHSYEEAEDGYYAVDMVREAEKSNNIFDMVLLDYEMPILNGPLAAMEIRETGSDVFIVGITGNMMAEDVEYFRSCGANAVLPKPFKMKSLEDLLFEFDVGNKINLTRKSVEDFNSSYEETMKTIDETDHAKSSSGSEAGKSVSSEKSGSSGKSGSSEKSMNSVTRWANSLTCKGPR